MIKAYLAWIPSYLEGEDIEIRYVIYKDGELIEKQSKFKDYCKPGFSGLLAMEELLEALEGHRYEDIQVIINDGSVYELLMGISMTNKHDLLRRAKKVMEEIDEFPNLEIENVSADHLEIEKWDKILTF